MTSSEERVLVRIKTEPLSPAKLQQSHMSVINGKKDIGGRLASFKSPRDLSLTAATSHIKSLKTIINPQIPSKKSFVPNVNVTRRKAQTSSNEPKDNKSQKPANDAPKRNNRVKPNYIQTQGVFSEGATAKPIKPTREQTRSDVGSGPRLDKPKLNLNRSTDKKKEESKMNDILKDDFLDDNDLMPDLSDPPLNLPLLLNARKRTSDDVESVFESLQIKTEKLDDSEPNTKVMKMFESSSTPQLLMFDFPPDLVPRKIDKGIKKEFKQEKKPKDAAQSEQLPCDRLSKLGEGQWGSLKILANGNMYMAIGNEKIPIQMVRYGPKQTVMSVTMDVNSTSKGAVINVGRVRGSFVCSSDLNLDDTKLK